MAQPTELHLMATKRILRYVKRTVNFSIMYKMAGNKEWSALQTAIMQDVKMIGRSHHYAFIFSSTVVAWSSRKQPIVSLSNTGAEFVAAADACQAVWMKRVLERP